MGNGKKFYYALALVILVALCFVYAPVAQAQYWAALPPYNTLWPLWSLPLSPINALTGLATPIVSNLLPTTTLPAQPGLTWDPSMLYPWLLYNSPAGMLYFDPFIGMNPWPAPSLLNVAGLPSPLTPPLGFAALPPTDPAWLTTNIPLGNAAALAYLGANFPLFIPGLYLAAL